MLNFGKYDITMPCTYKGTISAGDPVITYDDGGVAKVKKIGSISNLLSSLSSLSGGISGSYCPKIAYNPTADRFAILYTNSAVTSINLVGASFDGTNWTFSSPLQVVSSGGAGSLYVGYINVHYLPSINRFSCITYYFSDNSYQRIRLYSISGVTLSSAGSSDISTWQAKECQVICHATDSEFVIFGTQVNTNYPSLVRCTYSGSTITMQTEVVVESGAATGNYRGYFDTANNHYVFSYSNGGSKIRFSAYNIISNALNQIIAPSQHIEYTTANSGDTKKQIFYDTVNGLGWFVSYMQTGTVYRQMVVGAILNTGSSFMYYKLMYFPTDFGNMETVSLGYDTTNKRFYLFYISSNQYIYGSFGNYAGEGQIKWSEFKQFAGSTVFNGINQTNLNPFSINGKLYIPCHASSVAYILVCDVPDYTKVIGIAQESGSDADINKSICLLGGISKCHSGLTIGANYFIQSDGSIGLTPTNQFIGKAIDTKSILLKDLQL